MVDRWLVLMPALLGGYLLGSFPTAYLAARVLKGIDLRQHGSGNVGASNAAVHLGKVALFAVGALDLAKGVLPVVAAWWFGMGVEVQALAGLAAVVGHNWSVFLGFAGGRGMATGAGVLVALGLSPLVGFVFVFLMAGLLLRDSALWMGLGVALVPGLALALRQPPAVVLLCIGLVGLLAAKRLMGNLEALPMDRSWSRVLVYRLVYDRDIRDRKQWITRGPASRLPKG